MTDRPSEAFACASDLHAGLVRKGTETLLVSLADKVHNLGCIVRDYGSEGERLWDRFTADREDTHWYYRELLVAYKKGRHPQLEPLIGDFERLLQKLDRLIESSDAS